MDRLSLKTAIERKHRMSKRIKILSAIIVAAVAIGMGSGIYYMPQNDNVSKVELSEKSDETSQDEAEKVTPAEPAATTENEDSSTEQKTETEKINEDLGKQQYSTKQQNTKNETGIVTDTGKSDNEVDGSTIFDQKDDTDNASDIKSDTGKKNPSNSTTSNGTSGGNNSNGTSGSNSSNNASDKNNGADNDAPAPEPTPSPNPTPDDNKVDLTEGGKWTGYH